jgi:hypothetical protein
VKKKKRESKRVFCRTVKIYKNDAAEILEIFKLGGNGKVTISDKEYEYESLEEIEKQSGAKLKELDFVRYSPHLRVSLGTSGAYIYSIDTEQSLADMVRIQELLKSRKRPVVSKLLHPITLLGLVSLAILGFRKASLEFFPMALNSGSMILLGATLCFCYYVGSFSQVFLTFKHEEKSFWARNKDNLVIVVITAIITGLITVIASYYLFKQGIK